YRSCPAADQNPAAGQVKPSAASASPTMRMFVGDPGMAGGLTPSVTTSKSDALSEENAGLSTSLFHRVSYVPLMYMSDPLSATISPYFCIARKIFCTSGE